MIVTIDDICMFIPSHLVEPDAWDWFNWKVELGELELKEVI